MPLELSLYHREGADDFFVGDTRVSLVSIEDEHRFCLQVHGSSVTRQYRITHDRSVEILPNVRVSAGTKKRGARLNEVSVTIEAPRHIAIFRGSIRREWADGIVRSKSPGGAGPPGNHA